MPQTDRTKYLHALVNRIADDSHTRSVLAGPLLGQDEITVSPLDLGAIWRSNESLPPPHGVIIRYPTEGSHQPTIVGYEREIVSLRKLAAEPEFNRLNNVKQLSTTYLGSGVGGCHSRLEHTLGAFDAAVRFLLHADMHMRTTELNSPGTFPEMLRRRLVHAALVLALFHDAFHPPFGHVLDPLRPVLLPQIKAPRIDNAVKFLQFQAARAKVGWVWRLLRKVFSEPVLVSLLDDAVDMLEAADRDVAQLDAHQKAYAFIFDILWGPLDHDRFDYLSRDVAHLFVFDEVDPPLRLTQALENIRFMPDADGAVRLVFQKAVVDRLRDLLRLRQRLYNEVYEGRAKAAYDEMILHSVIFVLREYEAFEPRIGLKPNTPEWQFGIDFTRLSDLDLMHVINVIETTPLTWLSKTLLRDLLTNAPFVASAYREIDNRDLPDLAIRYLKHSKPIHLLIDDAAADFGRFPDQDRMERTYSRVANSLTQVPAKLDAGLREAYFEIAPDRWARLDDVPTQVPPTKTESLFWVLETFGLSAFRRFDLESWFWKEFKSTWGVEYDSWSSKVAAAYAADVLERPSEKDEPGHRAERARIAAEFRQTLDSTPLLFIYLTRLNPESIVSLWLKNAQHERDAFGFDEVSGKPRRIEGTPERSLNNYWMAVFRPQNMEPSADKAIRSIFDRFLDNDWAERYVRANVEHALH